MTATSTTTATATKTESTTVIRPTTTTETKIETKISTTTLMATTTKITVTTETVAPPPAPTAVPTDWLSVSPNTEGQFTGRWTHLFDFSADPRRFYLNNLEARFEDAQGNGDDTGLNGLRFHLYSPAGEFAFFEFAGQWGNWGHWVPAPDYIWSWYACGIAMRVEGWNGDNTASNGIRLKYCSRLNPRDQRDVEFAGIWGDWSSMLTFKNNLTGNLMRICAARVRSLDPIGGGDDYALNGLQVRFCSEI
eukprot:CAMPEP_0176468862 /NCGR_PEP_ID=MMETSP0127-20121128/39399_1 /TAXON_ID=938130 /ORGANISM="Platyophrya macrostoma, Strain WH" /LENGTH=248 /DNA_ID=CAMNT_0017862619 /DNA_START=513 /DNA_END=1259 /DNA_ORIENTATION=-